MDTMHAQARVTSLLKILHECTALHRFTTNKLNQEVGLLALPTLLTMHHAVTCASNLQTEQGKRG